ncbi:hypothetical protein D3C87_1685480 [compost metagenome]
MAIFDTRIPCSFLEYRKELPQRKSLYWVLIDVIGDLQERTRAAHLSKSHLYHFLIRDGRDSLRYI